MRLNKPLEIDMCAGSELKDTQGETLSIEGADIEDLQNGKGRINADHGKGFYNHLGMVTGAKKIFKAEDCENERHRYYWEKIKAPYIYVKAKLFNAEDHPHAKAAAAILSNIHREDIPLKLKASVEGGVLARGISDPTRLARSKIHSVALTFTPANNATLVEPLNINKSDTNWEVDKQLIKSVMHLAQTNIPSFRHIERHASACTIYDNIYKIKDLAKTLGVEVEVKAPNPDVMINNAVINKVLNNVMTVNHAIKELKKAADYRNVMNPTKLAATPKIEPKLPQLVKPKQKPLDTYQQEIGSLKSQGSVPEKPVDPSAMHADALKLKGGQQLVQQNTAKKIASRAMKDPAYLDNIANQFTQLGHPPEKVQAVINHIKSFMGGVEKSTHLNVDAAKSNLKKALLAGYSGSGVPTESSGGSVLQSQSLDAKKVKKKIKEKLSKSFKYVTCDQCGHEQVHMMYQVKCRKCNTNFNLEKMKDII